VSFAPLGFLILAAVIGSALVPLLILRSNLMQTPDLMRQGVVGALYLIICVLGLLAVFYPSKCRGMFQKSQNPVAQQNRFQLKISGHHPDCQNFSTNRIQVGKRTFCAACSGLLIGAIVASVGAVGFFFAGLNIGWSSIWLLVLGEFLMLLGLFQIKLANYSKAALNMLFVVGSLLVLVEADLLGNSLYVDLYVLGLIAFMLLLRILLSEWNNKRICQRCQSCFH
jgi:hypothetical protein